MLEGDWINLLSVTLTQTYLSKDGYFPSHCNLSLALGSWRQWAKAFLHLIMGLWIDWMHGTSLKTIKASEDPYNLVKECAAVAG